MRPGELRGDPLLRHLPPDGAQGPPGRRRHRRRRPHRRPTGLLLRPGPRLRRRLTGRGARRHDRPRAAAGRAGQRPRRRVHRVRWRAPAGGPRGPLGLRAGLRRERRALRPRAADLDHQRRLGRRGLLLPRAHGLRDHDRPRPDVPHRPGRRPRRPRRGRRRGEPRRPARARAQRRRAVRRPRRPRRGGARPRVARVPAPVAARHARDVLPGATGARRSRRRRPRGVAPGLRRPRRHRPPRRQRRVPRVRAALGAQHGLRLRPHRRPPGRLRLQPAEAPRRRHRRGRRDEGRPLHPHVQRLRAGARRARRHPRLHAGHRAGARRRHPPWSQARVRVRGGHRAAGDGHAAQELRRRAHRDELPRPRREPHVRLAGRPARRHGRQAGRRRAAPPRDRGRGGSGGRARRARRRLRRPAPRRRNAVAEGFIDELIEPSETRARLAWALSMFSGDGRRRERVANIPL